VIDAAFGHWLAGFIDGEGNFDVHRQQRPAGTYFYCRFELTLRADDRAILEECQRRLGGKLYDMRHAASIGRRPQVRWEIVSRAECLALAAVLTAHPLRSKKARDFATWSEALAVSCEHVGRNRADLMQPLWKKLRAGRAFA
jgi:hypothetical protein